MAHWRFRMGHRHPGGKGNRVVVRDIIGEASPHRCRQSEGRLPRSDEEKVVAAGEHGVSVAITCDAVLVFAVFAKPRQPDREERIDLPRQRRHLRKGRLLQALLKQGAEVIDVALDGHGGDFTAPLAILE